MRAPLGRREQIDEGPLALMTVIRNYVSSSYIGIDPVVNISKKRAPHITRLPRNG